MVLFLQSPRPGAICVQNTANLRLFLGVYHWGFEYQRVCEIVLLLVLIVDQLALKAGSNGA